jgi:hypothetical protein
LRLGWVTAAAPLVEKLTFCIHGTSLGACATTQARWPFHFESHFGDKGVSVEATSAAPLRPLFDDVKAFIMT